MAQSPRSAKKVRRSQVLPAEQTPQRLAGNAPLVFISHDSRDAAVAEAFSTLLADVSAGLLKSFRSSDKSGVSGIEFGSEWYGAIMARLDQATDVVALLTQRSTDRPWILYEAGVAKGKLDTNVLGVALGIPLQQVTSGPFGQFQNCAGDEDSLTTLVIQLLQRNPDAAPREEAVRRQVRSFLEAVKPLLTAPRKNPASEPVDSDRIAKMFEEIKLMFRDMHASDMNRLRSPLATLRPHSPHGLLGMPVEEFVLHPAIARRPSSFATAWLLCISHLRSFVPWLYEIGIDGYRALQHGDRETVAKAVEDFDATMKAILQGPLAQELVLQHPRELQMALRSLPDLFARLAEYKTELESPTQLPSDAPQGTRKRSRL
jgi:hypothetical protein